MADLRDQLERESERFVLEPGLLDRLHRRRRRRERNRRTAAGLVALVVFAGGLFGTLRALLPGESRPSVTPSTFGAIAGTYRVTLTDAVTGVRSNAMAGDYVLTFSAIDDPCVARRLLFVGRPWHVTP